MARGNLIEYYYQLYEYLEANPRTYHVVRDSARNEIVAYVVESSRERPVEEIIEHPVRHGRPCVHRFEGVEVSNPKVKIPGHVVDDVCYHLLLSKSLFAYYAPK